MITLFLTFSYDHHKYLRSGVIYVSELHKLEAEAPEALEMVKTEGFSVYWKDDKPFTGVSTDHGGEWVNGMQKSAGLANITQTNSATLK